MKTKCCDKCGKNISVANFDRHYIACRTKQEPQIKLDESWKQENGLYKCPYCEKEYSKSGITTHIWQNHTDDGKKYLCSKKKWTKPLGIQIQQTDDNLILCKYGCGEIAKYQLKNGAYCCSDIPHKCKGIGNRLSKAIKHLYDTNQITSPFEISRTPWNKDLTEDTDERIKLHSQRIREKYKNGELISKNKNTKVKPEVKQQISESMKKAHAEGRAHNIGESKHKSEPSYPEQFFIKVIDNEFDDKQYERELRFGKYALDFAWVHKKKCIEIDGQQHERFEKLKNSDIKKDQKLKDAGWEVLRLKWKDVFHNPKEYIRIAKDFIGK